MSDLIKLLEWFNRKERHFLALELSGGEKFTLSEAVKQGLCSQIGITIPDDAYVAFDYHLDWVDAALHKAYCMPNSKGLFATTLSGTQRDVDCFIVFESKGWHHLVFLEAKGPDAAWGKDQLLDKAKHMKRIFGKDGCKYNDDKVKPHFCMTSSGKPNRGLRTDEWPDWLTKKKDSSYYWFEWNLPGSRLKATRCNADGGNAECGEYFRID